MGLEAICFVLFSAPIYTVLSCHYRNRAPDRVAEAVTLERHRSKPGLDPQRQRGLHDSSDWALCFPLEGEAYEGGWPYDGNALRRCAHRCRHRRLGCRASRSESRRLVAFRLLARGFADGQVLHQQLQPETK
jgi:hypothetical protein